VFWHQIAEELCYQREDVLLVVIVSELQFLEVERETLRGNSVVLDDSFLGVAPEPLQAFDVNPAAGEVLPVVHPQVSVAAEHECVVDLLTNRCRQCLLGAPF